MEVVLSSQITPMRKVEDGHRLNHKQYLAVAAVTITVVAVTVAVALLIYWNIIKGNVLFFSSTVFQIKNIH